MSARAWRPETEGGKQGMMVSGNHPRRLGSANAFSMTMTTIEPFPNPEIPDVDDFGIMVPPWIKFPNLPFGSMGWRMGSGEYYWDQYRRWYQSQDKTSRRAARTRYPEPEGWRGFYFGLRWMGAHPGPYRAGVVGALVGDALGVPFEFKRPEDIPREHEIDMVMPASFVKARSAIPYGTCSDDGAQLLCLLEVLQEEEEFEPGRFSALLIKWLREGYHQSGGLVFDCGGQTALAIKRLEEGIAPLEAGGTDKMSNGNGSLMRTLPVAIIGHLCDWSARDIVAVAQAQSRVTHGHPISQVCCALYSLIATSLLDDPAMPVKECYRRSFAELAEIYGKPELTEHAKALLLIDDFPKTNFRRGSGYVIDTLWTAIDCMEKSASYASAVKAAVSYGNDTDTTACVTGGLAGIKYGDDRCLYSEGNTCIPGSWVSRLILQPESVRVIGLLS